MIPINCLVVEDEPLAAEVLEDYIRQVPFLHWQGTCPDALFAMEVLQREKIDLLFLDIHLPKLKGFDFIRTLHQQHPHIIITTAYHEYALQGYEFNVADYLMKPIEFSRFLIAVNKVKQLYLSVPSPAAMAAPAPARPSLYFNVGKKKIKIFVDDIIYIESLREYIRVVTSARTILTKMPLGQIEEQLAPHSFIRVHRSFIVSRDRIDAFSSTEVEAAGKKIPIGRSYKEQVQLLLTGNA